MPALNLRSALVRISRSTPFPQRESVCEMQSDRKRILYVDDDRDTCELTKFYLEDEGYELTCVGSVGDGLRYASLGSFDLYIIDERLPDGSGTDLTRQIRAFDAKTPLIFHSAAAHDEEKRMGLEAGAQAYITKPSIPSEVINTVNLLIAAAEASRLQRETRLSARTLRQFIRLNIFAAYRKAAGRPNSLGQ